jgi:5-methyltetrahydrofolate--homocysteine methyltransferase
LIDELSFKPIAVGANCGVGASDLVRTILDFGNITFPLIAKANAGIPAFIKGLIQYSGTPSLMAEYSLLAKRAGAKIIGGCCGSSAKHIQAMRDALDSSKNNKRPSLNEVEAILGKFSGIPGKKVERKRIRKRRN